MYELYIFPFAPNSIKPVLVAEELGINYELNILDPRSGEHRSPEHMARHPLGKVPVLVHDGRPLFEGAVICRYLASVEKSELYPEDAYERAVVDQWIDFFSQHLGRWINSLYFENVVGPKLKRTPNQDNIEEAMGFATTQAEMVDKRLEENAYLCGAEITIADIYAYAFVRAAETVGLPLDNYPKLRAWRDTLAARAAIQKAESKMKD